MSQISRRNFMKCAGAAALAIAASGILTGCDNTLDVEVTFVYNGQTLPLRGTGKVVTGEQYMDTATIVLPAEYQEQYKVRAEKVKVIRENGTRKAVEGSGGAGGKNCGLDGQLSSGRERSAVRLC